MAGVSRRHFFTRATPAAVAALLATGNAAAAAAGPPPPPATATVSARDLRRLSRGEVRQALRRIAARRRAR
jgi:hypothetical protein